MVNAGPGDAWTDEDTIFPPGGDDVAARAIAAAVAMEDAVRQSDLDWLILRGALFYGPGTGFDDDWFARARDGKLRLPGDGSGWVSLVHIADMAEATVAALERWPSRRALIVADDQPVRWRELFAYVAAIAGVVHFWMLVKSDMRLPLTFAFIVFFLLGYRVLHKYVPPQPANPRTNLFPQD
jgi:nucleoside-diphosphate-sugar epimerase